MNILYITLYVLATVGVISLFLIVLTLWIDPLILKYELYNERKNLEFWKEEIKAKQHRWQDNYAYDECVRFTLDFLRNYDKNLKETNH